MTPPQGVTLKEPTVNWRNFGIAARLAQHSGVTTAMITSKGEPTLFPDQVSRYLEEFAKYNFPLLELQTNGIPFVEKLERYDDYLSRWYELGLTTIAISIVHYDAERNREIYLPYRKEYIDLPALIERLHRMGFSVRLATVMVDGYIDSSEEVERLIGFARSNKVEQLTLRPVNRPGESRDSDVSRWVGQNYLRDESRADVQHYLRANGAQVMKLVHGAVVYDVGGQNVCYTNSLTIDAGGEDLRQLIFFPDGHIRYDWQYAGAVIL